MKKLLFLMALAVLLMPLSYAQTCQTNIQNIPATCEGGTITTDTFNGGRLITCSNGANSLTIEGWDKPTSTNPSYFEMYRKSFTGSGIKICLDAACIKDNGFAKSSNYPICSGTPTCTPSAEVCDSVDNNCNGQVDENNVCSPSGTACYSNLANIPATCESGAKTADTYDGCRKITCASGSSSTQILACDKPNSNSPAFFEMYRQNVAGAPIKTCIGSTCIQNEGYVKSTNYPICVAGQNSSTNNQTKAIADLKLITTQNGATFPLDHNAAFQCNANFNATNYTFNFGDGTIETRPVFDIYHTYTQNGTFTVTCTAFNPAQSASDSIQVSIITGKIDTLTNPFMWASADVQKISQNGLASTFVCEDYGYSGEMFFWFINDTDFPASSEFGDMASGGKQFNWTFSKAGTYRVKCRNHLVDSEQAPVYYDYKTWYHGYDCRGAFYGDCGAWSDTKTFTIQPSGNATIEVFSNLSAEHNQIFKCFTSLQNASHFIWLVDGQQVFEKIATESYGPNHQTFPNYFHSFPRNGTYSISCIAENNQGQSEMASRIVSISTPATPEEIAINPFVTRGTATYLGNSSIKIECEYIGIRSEWAFNRLSQDNIITQYGNISYLYGNHPELDGNIWTSVMKAAGPRENTAACFGGTMELEEDQLYHNFGTRHGFGCYGGASGGISSCNIARKYMNVSVPDQDLQWGIHVQKVGEQTYNATCYMPVFGHFFWIAPNHDEYGESGEPITFSTNQSTVALSCYRTSSASDQVGNHFMNIYRAVNLNQLNNTTIPPVNQTQQCFSKVNDIPANCTATITQDTKSGCRTIICGSGANTIKVMACDKPDTGTKQYFEMYRQSFSGVIPKLCIGSTCIQNEGYKKSENYPICVGGTNTDTTTNNATSNNTTNTTTINSTVFIDQGASSTLFLDYGFLNGKLLNDNRPYGSIRRIITSTGQNIAGSLNFEYNSSWAPETAVVFGMTPSWGNHESSFKSLGNVNSGLGTASTSINFTAPTTPGLYHITFAYRAETTHAHLFSMTNWARGSPVWNDGNDISDWSESQINDANANGRTIAPVLVQNGMRNYYVPSTAIEVEVRTPDQMNHTSMNFIINGQYMTLSTTMPLSERTFDIPVRDWSLAGAFFEAAGYNAYQTGKQDTIYREQGTGGKIVSDTFCDGSMMNIELLGSKDVNATNPARVHLIRTEQGYKDLEVILNFVPTNSNVLTSEISSSIDWDNLGEAFIHQFLRDRYDAYFQHYFVDGSSLTPYNKTVFLQRVSQYISEGKTQITLSSERIKHPFDLTAKNKYTFDFKNPSSLQTSRMIIESDYMGEVNWEDYDLWHGSRYDIYLLRKAGIPVNEFSVVDSHWRSADCAYIATQGS